MSAEELAEYANSKPCEECGLPIAACNKIAQQRIEIERLRRIETAAKRFAKEADDSPRYISVRHWATREADPYLNFRAALGIQQSSSQEKP